MCSSKYYTDPNVTVIITKFTSNRVRVIGYIAASWRDSLRRHAYPAGCDRAPA